MPGRKRKPHPQASQVIVDILRPMSVAQVTTYLEATGWTLKANHFTSKDGWTLLPEITNPHSCVYVKLDPKEERHYKVEVPGCEDSYGYLGMLQFAIERIAAVEETTFITIICRVLGVEQLVLIPEKQRGRRRTKQP